MILEKNEKLLTCVTSEKQTIELMFTFILLTPPYESTHSGWIEIDFIVLRHVAN